MIRFTPTLAVNVAPFLCAVCLASGAGAQNAAPEPNAPPSSSRESIVLDLTGAWEFMEVGAADRAWRPATVPGCVHTDLMANGMIPDPFFKRNELVVEDLENRSWVYRKKFNVEKAFLDRRRIEIVCEGLDTVAELYLNGQNVGRTNNMFRRWTGPVRQALIEGENVLDIVLRSPMEYIRALPERRYDGPLPASNDPVGGSPYLRKAPYHFGWDWGPRLVTSGIWRPIRLVASDGPRIDYLTTQQRHGLNPETGKRFVDLSVTLDVDALSEEAAEIEVLLNGQTAARESFTLPAAASRPMLTTRVEEPELWWPVGHGAPKLYDLSVKLRTQSGAEAQASARIGFRTIELENRKDDDGISFVFVVNGRRIFAKGANWIPADSFPTRMNEARYRELLESAAACNMNMLRVWGGGYYEEDVFYDICDELGLLVWQDFMFACSAYPGNKAFLENVRQEAQENVKRLMNHPSIALWCGNNECESLIRQWFKIESTHWRHYQDLYHDLLPEVCAALDPGRAYWPASPHSIESPDPGEPTDGDTHYWKVWHGDRPFEDYETVPARFVSEFGFQSFPSIRTVRTWAGEGDLDLNAPDVAHHQKNPAGNKRILSQMLDRFRMPSSFENFTVLSQLQQALAMQIGVEHWRRSMPRCMGLLYWQLNDCWPVASWSSIDYYGRWKALQYFARRFYEPVHLSASGGRGAQAVAIHATNDSPSEARFTLRWALRAYAGDVITSGSSECTVAPNTSAELATVAAGERLVAWREQTKEKPHTVENAYLSFSAEREGTVVSRGVHHFAFFKDLNLPRPQFQTRIVETDHGVEVTVASDVFAKWVWIEAEGEEREGRFSDNFFDLEPGESRTVLYGATKPAQFLVRSLVDTYAD